MSIKAKIAQTVAKQVLLVKKESPTILFVAGVASVGTSTVLACKATLKLGEKVDLLERGNKAIANMTGVTDKERRNETLQLKASFIVDVAKLYAPAIAFAVIGVASLSGSHYLLNKRNAALTAAYAGLDQTYREYRKRVAQELGVDKERQLHYEAQNAVSREKNKDGTPSKTRKRHESNIYCRFFDQLNPNWEPIPEYNKVFLHAHQQWANNQLNAKGYLFLNEVYKDLGMEPSRAGQVVGWVLSDDGSTDNFVDFGIFDGDSRELRAFVNGDEGSILLDFNVSGNILDRVRFLNR